MKYECVTQGVGGGVLGGVEISPLFQTLFDRSVEKNHSDNRCFILMENSCKRIHEQVFDGLPFRVLRGGMR